ncbi:2-dehydro-3-deoxyphosphogluconate aldolase / (4S)-4-hydroxy-2-oxoglutarate aldolase [Cnuella takakiae]|uniref:2-dehydro-3-deoxyphosphogluconate aldolase / (4S)-4-hydroxy-2-oxoglutarate aldolase n=1 Tax=Cnuella takakiae TaxID=1302690 RepID=A0A1M5A272_9BACT|nr:bifunctional 4-hydroxy-2-oxoglutarate aldolase/2-dehydro-3-deoxy-phosphogluconate aldolase [Cnuella takakiae]OLY92123.1 bifunctional 4-hydroxy-2-oxoglutarate aldolase/2-dehydro-3-deoxy-phosphogluconate aldolase [Cnuella takakiae]SHF24344.1 2-dehydro-3-deoxyphosphogluconate aldolase / (4S)-4-hydroxy-2-oxoglutarate aldolase [Cnuella takakiae]
MPTESNIFAGIAAQQVLPLYYHDDAQVSIKILKALYAAGIHYVEYTDRGGAALENFKAMRAVANELEGLFLGIGTIKNIAKAEAYIAAGADFIIAPSVNVEVGAVCAQAGKPWIPGCMTPTEIATAENAGATMVKIFPGSLLGPGYITAIKELFPGMRYLVTGGVEATADNLKGWFNAGVTGVGMGSKVLTKELIAAGDYPALTEKMKKALELAKAAKE